MTRNYLQQQRKLKFRVLTLDGKEVLKVRSRKIAIAYATLLDGIVLSVR